MLPLVWAIVNGKEVVRLNSRAAEKGAQSVIDVMGQHGARASVIFNRVAEICTGLGEVTADRLKRQAILQEMLSLI
jgi:hypothetical protein